MKKIIGDPNQKNEYLINLINKTKINHYYIKNYKEFRDRIIKDISSEDVVLDCGKAMREKFQDIKCKTIETIDVNDFGDYPDIILDLCSDDVNELQNRYDKIICMAILEHVYNPFKAVENLKKILKSNGKIYGYVPYLYHYHAHKNLKFRVISQFPKVMKIVEIHF